MTGVSIGTGLSLTCDTLISQVDVMFTCPTEMNTTVVGTAEFPAGPGAPISKQVHNEPGDRVRFLGPANTSVTNTISRYCLCTCPPPPPVTLPYVQTYGSGNLKRVGVILQRGILILLLACFPCWAILINTEPLLLAVRQSPEVARSVKVTLSGAGMKFSSPCSVDSAYLVGIETRVCAG